MPRVFYGIPISVELRKEISKRFQKVPGRRVPPRNWHFTLKFVGSVKDPTSLLRHVEGIPFSPFEIVSGDCGAFPSNERAKVLWLGLSEGSSAMSEIATRINMDLEALGFQFEPKPFVPHLTLSRLKSTQNISAWINRQQPRPIRMTVNQINLYESIPSAGGSPEYRVLASKMS